MMSFTNIVYSSNFLNANTNNTYKYKFIGGEVSVPEGMESMVSSSQVPSSIFHVTNACNHNLLKDSFPNAQALD